MRPRLSQFLAALLGAAAVLGAGSAGAKPPMWVVRDADSEIVLFGSVHVLPPGLDWQPAALKRAVARADDIWFELPMDPQTEAETTTLASEIGVLAPDKSLFRLLPPADAELMAQMAQTYDLSPMLLDRLKPWLAEVALGDASYRKAGADIGLGPEHVIAAEARPAAAQRAFETPAEQLQIFDATPLPDQVASLEETLKELRDDPGQYHELLHAWMTGDVGALDREALQPLRKASPDLFRRLVTERNARWVKTLQARLKGHGRTVVVVGVGHLVGPGGLPARLRALGYSVQGP